MLFDVLYLDGAGPHGTSLHRAPRAPGGPRARRTQLADAQLPPGRRQGPAGPDQAARARGTRRQAPRQPLPARPAHPRLAEGEEPHGPGARDRRLASRVRAAAPDTLGALLVGYNEDDGGERHLRYAGRVGTGFTDDELDRLAGLLEPLRARKSPFTGRQPPREAIFVEPKLVAEVAFREWTTARTLRAPVYKGLRPDKKPEEVVFEKPGANRCPSGFDYGSAVPLHPAENRGYRELYVTARAAQKRLGRLAMALLDGTESREPVDKAAESLGKMLEELGPVTARHDLYGDLTAQGGGANFGLLRGAVFDRFLERNQALRVAVDDLEHVTTLLAYLATVSETRGDAKLAEFCRSWERRLRRQVSAVRKAAVALGSDPDAAVEPLDASAAGRAAHRLHGRSGRWASGPTARSRGAVSG